MLHIEMSSSDSELGAVTAALPEAVLTAVAAVEQSNSLPSRIEKAADGLVAVNDSLGVANSISVTWFPLLDKVKLFSELVDGITEVRLLLYHPLVS
jgi:hypothetical protein